MEKFKKFCKNTDLHLISCGCHGLTVNDLMLEAVTDINIKRMYANFNAKYFDNKLPRNLTIKWFNRKGLGGAAGAKVRRTKRRGFPDKVEIVEISFIAISKIYERNESGIEEIMIHEMIHVWLYTQGVFDTTGRDKQHGLEFQLKKREVEPKFGRAIPDSEKVSDLNLSTESETNKREFGIVLYYSNRSKSWALLLYTLKNFRKDFDVIVQSHTKLEEIEARRNERPWRELYIGEITTSLHNRIRVKRSFNLRKNFMRGVLVKDNIAKEALRDMIKKKVF